MKRLSIVVPVHNEEGNIAPLHAAVHEAARALPYELEFIFVDDGSSDKSVAAILQLAADDARVKLVEFSRNFGKEIALTAGIHEASGDAVITIDADLQHPPAKIAEFVQLWEQGADVVVGVRRHSEGETLPRRLGSALFNSLMHTMSDVPPVAHSTDFRLIGREVADAFRRMGEHRRMTRALIDWLGFRRAYVYFDAPARLGGASQQNYRSLFTLAFSGIIAHSFFPLRLAGYLGGAITFLSGFLGLSILIEQLILGDPLGWEITGTAMLAVMILFLVGVILVALGLMALYVESIKSEVTGRPLYIIRRQDISSGR
jgi:dolichol-phosphate mannosyltransferase